MKDSETLERLKKLQDELLAKHVPVAILKKIQAIQVTIDEIQASNKDTKTLDDLLEPKETSAHESVIRATLAVMDERGKRVENRHIIEYIQRNKVYWGKGGNI